MILKIKIAAEIFMLAILILLLVCRKPIRRFLSPYARRIAILLTILTPFLTFVINFVLVRVTPRNFKLYAHYGSIDLTFQTFCYNILIYVILLLILLAVTNSMKVSCVVCSLICVIFGIADYYVCILRGDPILYSDLASLNTALSVADNYTWEPSFYCIFALECVLALWLFFRCLGATKLFQKRGRVLLSVGTLLASALFVKTFLFSDYLVEHGVTLIHHFKPQVTYQRYGSLLTFLQSFRAIYIEKPEGYSTEQIQAIADHYPSDTADNQEELPSIIVVIDEAFSDLAVLGDLPVSEDYLPYFHSIWDSCIHGYSYASIFGNHTANTEFEVLTGNSMALIPQNTIAFQAYLKDEMSSLASLCASMGYQELTAVHPFTRDSYRRNIVYPLLGFQNYLSEDDFPEDTLYIRNYVSDKSDFDMLISRYEAAKETSSQPVFLYTMSMQNHGGYNSKEYENLSNEIQIQGMKEGDGSIQYLNLLKHTDDALREMTEYFSKKEEPVVILFLGDHQPNLSDDFYEFVTNGTYQEWTSEEMMKQYAVPFIIWSNQEMEHTEYEKTSMNYLSTILSEACGLSLSGYQKYLKDLSGEIPAITAKGYWGENGTFYQPDDTSSPYYEKYKEYLCVLYNNIIDTQNRPEGFYGLK